MNLFYLNNNEVLNTTFWRLIADFKYIVKEKIKRLSDLNQQKVYYKLAKLYHIEYFL